MILSKVGCALYVGSGVLQPVLIDWLRLHHALGRRWLLLPTLANAVAMAATGVLARRTEWQHMTSQLLPLQHTRTNYRLCRLLLLTATTDLCSGMLLAGGILWTGGSVYILLYNSVPVWTVVLSKLFLTKTRPIRVRQWTGVLLVTVGLASTVLASPTTTTASTKVTQGSIMVLLGSLLQAAMFILTEIAVHPSSPTTSSSTILSARVWCSLVGSLEASFMTIWVTVGYVLWGFWEEEDDNNSTIVYREHAGPCTILGGFLALCTVNAIHAAAFFGLLQQIGAAGSSLLRGLQTVVVVLVSALVFCSPHEQAQCLTPLKSFSLIVVLTGMYIYSSSSSHSRDNNKKHHHSPGEVNNIEHHSMA